MNRATSVYLDLVRFLAAAVVFISHARHDRFTGEWLKPFGGYGTDAVMAFFVLSGLVIAYVADTREKSFSDFALSRLARLYSVVAPALLLTAVLDFAGSHIDPGVYDGWWFASDSPVQRLFINLFFVNELWFASIRPLTNGPFWSIGYEFWYYVIFAVAVYAPRNVRRWLLPPILFFVGPKILLLFPVWLLGVAVYRFIKEGGVSEPLGWLLFGGTIALYALYRDAGVPHRLLQWTAATLGERFVYDELLWSKEFIWNYCLGLLIAGHFIGFAAISKRLAAFMSAIARPVRYIAGFTFALYLTHYPLLQFFAALTHNDPDDARDRFIVLGATLLSVVLIGVLTERRKSAWRSRFEKIHAWLVSRFVKARGAA